MPSRLDPKVYFFSDGVKLNLGNRRKLKSFVKYIFKNEKNRLETICFIFTTDKKLHKINRIYLKHDSLTDIITFELNSQGLPIVADVFMSLERIKENAQIMKKSIHSEIHRIIFHGALHLCGYTDKTIPQQKKMRKKEDDYLAKYFNSVSRDSFSNQ